MRLFTFYERVYEYFMVTHWYELDIQQWCWRFWEVGYSVSPTNSLARCIIMPNQCIISQFANDTNTHMIMVVMIQDTYYHRSRIKNELLPPLILFHKPQAAVRSRVGLCTYIKIVDCIRTHLFVKHSHILLCLL